jgi:hypothetical protein
MLQLTVVLFAPVAAASKFQLPPCFMTNDCGEMLKAADVGVEERLGTSGWNCD